MKRLLLILGDQLFDFKTHYSALPFDCIFMAEDEGLCTHFQYHQLKILMFLTAMREYRDAIPKKHALYYFELEAPGDFLKRLKKVCVEQKISEVVSFEVEDEFFESKLSSFFQKEKVSWIQKPSPGFLFSRDQFRSYLTKQKRPLMKTFYERMRKETGILMKNEKDPVGGKFSFDEENRKPLPKKIDIPERPSFSLSTYTRELKSLIEKKFVKHPGSMETIWFPVTRKDALRQLEDFIRHRFALFGPYEDAMHPDEAFLFHSTLSPSLNCGLLTPREVIDRALRAFEEKQASLSSVEGFVRQIMGWREFIRGIYRQFSEKEESSNFFKNSRMLSQAWYEGSTGILPLDAVIKRVNRLGYAHHIERLMVLSNLMLLSEIHPKEVHRWFMEMFIDSADWVMGPNVYGMGQFSDGGIFATKPYICGSNYLLKMGRFPKGPWTETVDGLYWSFISKHRDYYAQNPRMSVMVKSLDRMESARKKRLFECADRFREKGNVMLAER